MPIRKPRNCRRECVRVGCSLGRLECFENKIEKIDEHGCWLWGGARNPKGYGGFQHHGWKRTAHRAAYEFFVGVIPPGLFVLHRCDTPACVNPDHLFLGNNVDNMADMVRKGRQQKGEQVGRGKLTEEDAMSIFADPRSLGVVAKSFGVSDQSVWAIKTKRAWKHLHGEQHARG